MRALLFASLVLQILLFGQGQEVLQCPILRVFFEIDASLSIQQSDFNNEVSVVRSLINSIQHSVGSQAGYIPFDADISLASLRPLSTDLEGQISRLSTLGLGSSGTTSFTNALRYANETVFQMPLVSTQGQNVLVFITDGIDPNAVNSDLIALSNALRNEKTTIIVVIGFGNIPNSAQLVTISSSTTNTLLFPNSQAMADNFQQIFADTNICSTVQLVPPTGLSANDIESTRMTIRWTPSTSPVTEYRVCYSTSTDSNNICDNMVTTQLTASSQIISGLSPFTQYRYAVFSINNNALQRSSIELATTAQEASSVPVQGLFSQVFNFNTVTVNWQAPPQLGRNGIITQFEICYLPLPSEVCQPLVLENAQTFNNTATVMANTQYRARVSPISSGVLTNQRGMSASVIFNTPQFPAIDMLIARALTATEILVEWPSPSFTVNSYILTASDGSNPPITVNPAGTDTSFVISGAIPFTNYQVVLQAVTNNGLNLPSDSVPVMTLQAPPSGPVVNLVAEGFTPISIRINFTQPPMNTWNGILTSYLICVRDTPQSVCERSIRVDYAVTISHIFEGLRADTPYNVSVSPLNIAGQGPENIVAVRTAAADIPPVLDLRGEQVGARQISVTWRNPPEAADTSIVGGIRVCYGEASIDCQFSVDLPRTAESVLLNITEPINPYYIVVALTTPSGSRGRPNSIFVNLFIVEVGDLTSDAVSTNEILVSWTAPTVPIQFTLQAYSICVRRASETACLRNFTVLPNTLIIVLEGLDPNTLHSTSVFPVILEDFFIRVQTTAATTFPASPPDAPALVSVDFALRRALRISWTLPTTPTGMIITYEIVYQGTVVDRIGVRSVNATMDLMYRTIFNLEEAETYMIQVRAIYTTGPGSLTVPVLGTTLEDAPSSPVTDLAARLQEGDGILVTYFPPILINMNGRITRYDVICDYESNGMSRSVVNRVDGETHGVTLFNLPPQTICNITVIPFTAIGPGPGSAVLAAVTQDQVNFARFCDDFRIGVSLVTILSALLIVAIIALIAFVLIHYWSNHRKPKSDSDVVIYAQPQAKTV